MTLLWTVIILGALLLHLDIERQEERRRHEDEMLDRVNDSDEE